MALVKRKPIEGQADTNTNKTKSVYGRIYIFELILDNNTTVYKVGMVGSDSMSRVTDRLMEVLRSFFMQYRYVPRSRIVKAKKFRIPYIVENYLHKLLADSKYRFEKKFDGCKEFFYDIDLDMLVNYIDGFNYNELLRGETSMKIDRYEAICKAIKAEQGKDEAKDSDKLPF